MADQISRLNQEVRGIRQQLQASESSRKSHENQIEALQQAIHSKEREHKKLESTYNELCKSMASSHDDKERSHLATIERQLAEISNQCAVIDDLKKKLADAKSQLINLSDQNKSLRTDTSRLDSLRVEYESLKEQFDEIRATSEQERNELEDRLRVAEAEALQTTEQLALIANENVELREMLRNMSTTDQVKKGKYETLTRNLSEAQNRCRELDKVNESLHFEIETLISEKNSLTVKLEQNEEEAKVFVANYEKECQAYKERIEKGRRQCQKLREQVKEMTRKLEANPEEMQYSLAQRVFELENQLCVVRRNPAFALNSVKLTSYDEEIQRLQAKIVGLQADQERQERGPKPSADALIVGAFQSQIRELKRKNERLAYDNMLLTNTQDITQAEMIEMQKRLDEERIEREQICHQLTRIRTAQRMGIKEPDVS
jgi:chromosome segregation ATPase